MKLKVTLKQYFAPTLGILEKTADWVISAFATVGLGIWLMAGLLLMLMLTLLGWILDARYSLFFMWGLFIISLLASGFWGILAGILGLTLVEICLRWCVKKMKRKIDPAWDETFGQ